jgi:periplasmic protein TonB
MLADGKTATGGRYRRPDFIIGRARAFLYALILVVVMFVTLPFTEYLSDIGKNQMTIRRVDLTIPPPPPSDFDKEPPLEQPKSENAAPKFQEAPAPLDLSQLEMALNPGLGDAMAGAFAIPGFDLQPNAALADLEIFELSDLDQVPRLKKGVKPRYPKELLSERVGGLVRLKVLLDVNGHVRVLEVMESDRKEFETPAIEAAEQFLYDAPTRDGKPVNTQFILPIRFTIN